MSTLKQKIAGVKRALIVRVKAIGEWSKEYDSLKKEKQRIQALQRDLDQKMEEAREIIKGRLLEAGLNKVDLGELGLVNLIALKDDVEVESVEELSDSFKKKVVSVKPDFEAIRAYIEKTGKAPKGVKVYKGRYTVRIQPKKSKK